MRRLLWKEYRERRLWAIPLMASVVGVIALGRAYTYCGDLSTFTGWVIPSALVAMLFGMSAYSSELAWETPDFLHSRPVSWKRMLAAKLVFGLGIIVLVVLLGALAFRLGAPEPYRRFASVVEIAPGVGLAMLWMGIPYLIGFCCSVVFPGTIGAILMLVAFGIAIAGEFAFLNRLALARDDLYLFAWFLALPLAALLVIRFGLTLSIASRVKRYALAVILVVGVLTTADTITHWDPWCSDVSGERKISISPDGRFALVIETRTSAKKERPYYDAGTVSIVRLADNRVATGIRMDFRDAGNWKAKQEQWDRWNSAYEIRWTPNGTAYIFDYNCVTDRHGKRRYVIPTMKMAASGRAQAQAIEGRPLPPPEIVNGKTVQSYVSYLMTSPDGRIASLLIYSLTSGWRLDFVDVERMRVLPVVLRDICKKETRGKYAWFRFPTLWWQSNDEIGYIDPNGQRRIVRVSVDLLLAGKSTETLRFTGSRR